MPTVWKKMGEHLHQDYLYDHPDFYSGITEFAEDLSSSERKELRQFLVYLTENEFAGGVLKRVWAETNGYIGIRPRGKDKWKDLYIELLRAVDGT